MNDTEIKTRLGYILQGIVRIALERARISFAENFQYDPACQEPDFLIPDSVNPKFIVEVHQTDSRDSFRMKTLRAFTAVTEAKAFYGDSLTSVNIVFGDPNVELPPSNIRALFGFFDVNLVPRYNALNTAYVVSLEDSALRLASDEDWSVVDSVNHLSSSESYDIDSISQLLQSALNNPSTNEFVHPLWNLERERVSAIGSSPEVGDETYYKRNILRALYFSDEHFSELVDHPSPSACTSGCSEEAKQQLVLTELAEGQPSLAGLRILSINDKFAEFLQDSEAENLRNLGKARLDADPAMHWFFEDIRDPDRRLEMANVFFELLTGGASAVAEAVTENLESDDYRGIHHRRCWIADLAARYLGVSHNEMNRQFTAHGFDPQRLGNPYNQMSYKSERFMADETTHETYAAGVEFCFEELANSANVTLATNENDLASRLLKLRLDGVIKLHKLNPLYLVSESLFLELGLRFSYKSTSSILSDLAGSVNAVAKHKIYHVTNGSKTVLVNPVAVHDSHGDDKSKEWGARRLSTLYRALGGEIQESGYEDGIFVIDGEWEQKDVNRLHRCGWNYVVRLSNLETALREVFNLA